MSSIQEIKQSLQVIFQPGDTIELRCVGRRVLNGYYREIDTLAKAAHALNSTHKPLENCFIGLNPCNPDLHARRPDTCSICGKGEAVGDADIRCRRWLLIDIDPVRPTGESATDMQKQAGVGLAQRAFAWLQEQLGLGCIICADSGNGAHMLIRLPDVPIDRESAWVCERFLQLLSEKFSNDQAKVDTKTHNASRICTLYGTMKRKGSDTPTQPHRLSKLVRVPDPLEPVDWEKLKGLVEPWPGNQVTVGPAAGWQAGEMDALLNARSIKFRRDDQYRTADGASATRWELEVCPFNPKHNDRSAYLIKFASGAMNFGCHHDGCAGKDWQTLKQLWQLPDGGDICSSDITLPTQPQMALAITAAHTIQPQAVDWLWHDKIALGKLTIIAGYGGVGKTFLTCDLAARISAGLPAPDGQQLRSGRVLIATGEDGLADTLVPRLIAHQADLQRVSFIEGLQAGDQLHLLDLLRHIEFLRAELDDHPDTVLLLVDPISSFMGEGIDTHKASDVRRVLSAVARLAEEHAVAFVGIHHLRKASGPAIHAVTGSQAFSDAVRTVWLVGLDRDDPHRRLMLPNKNNLAETHGSGMAYTIDSGRVIWESEPVLMAADDMLQDDGDATPRDEAKNWLTQRLQDEEPQSAKDLLKEAKGDGITDKTLRRAKKELGIVSRQHERVWVWQWPQTAVGSQVATSDAQKP